MKGRFKVIDDGGELILGQKLMPLTKYNITNPKSLLFNPWRELYFNLECAILVLNYISPSFPVPVGWFYIQNGGKELYDNRHIHELFNASDESDSISKLLINASTQSDAFPSELSFHIVFAAFSRFTVPTILVMIKSIGFTIERSTCDSAAR